MKIRVFISSTMKDLANERDAVARRIAAFNFEPVNAEVLLPDGTKSWDRLLPEILSSHLFVLILGERYGWIPKEGPGAGDGLSVTHMEARAARAAGIPILPFLKHLDEDADRDSDDAKKRAAFRKEIEDWGSLQREADDPRQENHRADHPRVLERRREPRGDPAAVSFPRARRHRCLHSRRSVVDGAQLCRQDDRLG